MGNVTRDQIAVMLHKFASNVHLQMGPKKFVDEWAGFSLTFPKSWRGYLYETLQRQTHRSDMASLTQYEFGMLNSKNQFEVIMRVHVWEKAKWTAHQPNEIEQGNVIGQNDSYVIVLSPEGEGVGSPELDFTVGSGEVLETIRQSFAWVN